MVCPKCGSANVNIISEQTEAKTGTKGNGCLWALGRWTLILCTCGLWLLVGKHKGKSTTKFKSETMGLCQSCGNKWKI